MEYSTSADLTFLSKENHRCEKKDFRCMILRKGSTYFLLHPNFALVNEGVRPL